MVLLNDDILPYHTVRLISAKHKYFYIFLNKKNSCPN